MIFKGHNIVFKHLIHLYFLKYIKNNNNTYKFNNIMQLHIIIISEN